SCTGPLDPRGPPVRALSHRHTAYHRLGMDPISRRTRSVQRPASLAMLAVLAATLLGAGTAVASVGDPMPMVLQNISLSDISTNYGGICNGGFTTVMKSASGPNNAVN